MDSFVSLVHLQPISHDVQVLLPGHGLALAVLALPCLSHTPVQCLGKELLVPHPSYQPLIPHLVWPPLSDPWKNYMLASKCICLPSLDDPPSLTASHQVPPGDRCIAVECC